MSDFVLEEVTVASDLALPEEVNETTISSLVSHVLSQESARGTWVVGFQFVSDSEMQRMHLEFMGLDSSTDIMTFPYEAGEWGENGVTVGNSEVGGDIVISFDRAADQASEGNWSTSDELLFLVAHGMLHLLGWDDGSDSDRARMLDRQRFLLKSFHP